MIHTATNLVLFFKYEHEYKSYSHTLGNTIVFGGNWTLRIPKPPPRIERIPNGMNFCVHS